MSKFHFPSFLLGTGVGALLFFAVLNGGACRPSPTPTDDDPSKPIPVDAPKPKDDKPIAVPEVKLDAAKEVAPKVEEVKPVAPIKIEVSAPNP